MRADNATLLVTGYALSRVLCEVLGPAFLKKGCGPIREGPKTCNKNDKGFARQSIKEVEIHISLQKKQQR